MRHTLVRTEQPELEVDLLQSRKAEGRTNYFDKSFI